jgi:hypothetical protein
MTQHVVAANIRHTRYSGFAMRVVLGRSAAGRVESRGLNVSEAKRKGTKPEVELDVF